MIGNFCQVKDRQSSTFVVSRSVARAIDPRYHGKQPAMTTLSMACTKGNTDLHLTPLDIVGVRLDSFADSQGKIESLFDRLSI